MARWIAPSIGLAGAAIAIGLLLWLWAPPANKPSPPADPAAPRADVLPEAAGARATLRTLRGTTASGGLAVDASGHFAPDRGALLFFEYFLSASRDEPIDDLLGRMRAAVRERLDPPADAEALAFLEQYVAYLEIGGQEFNDPGMATGADLEQRFQWLREFRRAHFGAELATRLFAADEDAARVQLAMRRVREDESIDETERARQLLALEETLPEEHREARARAAAPLRLARDEARLRETGASDAEIQSLRERRFGAKAAERLAENDRARAAWQSRWERYRREHVALASRTEAGERDEAIAALRAEHFEPNELERVRVLDRIEARH